MVLYTLFYALTLGLLIALLFTGLTKNKGPWDNFWVLFIVLTLGIWVAALWVAPVGPVWQGVAWLDLVVIGLLLAMLIGATVEANERSRRTYEEGEEVDLVKESKKDAVAITMFGIFFWIFLVSLLAMAVIGVVNYV